MNPARLVAAAPKQLESLWPTIEKGRAVYRIGERSERGPVEISMPVTTAVRYEGDVAAKREMLFTEFKTIQKSGFGFDDESRDKFFANTSALYELARIGAAQTPKRPLVLDGIEVVP